MAFIEKIRESLCCLPNAGEGSFHRDGGGSTSWRGLAVTPCTAAENRHRRRHNGVGQLLSSSRHQMITSPVDRGVHNPPKPHRSSPRSCARSEVIRHHRPTAIQMPAGKPKFFSVIRCCFISTSPHQVVTDDIRYERRNRLNFRVGAFPPEYAHSLPPHAYAT